MMSIKHFFIIFLLIFSTGNAMANTVVLQCEEVWNKFDAKSAHESIPTKIQLWKENKDNCKPNGYFYYSLSKLYLANQDFDNAKESTAKGLGFKDEAFMHNEVMALSIKFSELSFKPLTDKGWAEIENNTQLYINKYQNFSEGHVLMASIKLARGDYDGAITFAGRAGYLEGGLSPLTGRILTISYTEKKRYKEAIQIGNNASTLDNRLFADKYFMLALVRSYVGAGDIDIASKILKLLVHSNPGLKTDIDVQRYARFLQDKIIEREQQGR